MQLYNTLTHSLEPFTPIETGHVRMYSCGPTVYDHAHIGNLSAYIFADTLRRTLAASGYRITHAMNYTDVDDKTIRRSRERYPDEDPNVALRKLTDEYIAIFLHDMSRIGNDIHRLTFLRATDEIEGMQALVTTLHQDGFAYIADDGVYFSIAAYKDSGKTYGQLLELQESNTSEARIQNDEYDKESVHDFALWKKRKQGEPSWDFSLDGHDLPGRPGWHIECSVMSRKALGQPFDVHTGGVDLIFPHHENEIAQSTAGEANPVMSAFFAHNEHILVDGKKMAKSAQNFYTLTDVQERGYDPLAFRLMILQAHYRNQVNFTWESLEAAQNRLQRFRNLAVQRFQTSVMSKESSHVEIPKEKILAALQNDLDTPRALALIESYIDQIEQTPSNDPSRIEDFITFLDDSFGLDLLQQPDISGEQKQYIAKRQQARDAKDWSTSDEMRGQLAAQGIGVRDSPRGPVWFRQ